MKICVLASGSKGNCTYIESENHRILIDLGTSCLSIEKQLKKIGVNPETIDGVFITHNHTDHISALKVFLKKNNSTLYIKKNTLPDLEEFIPKKVVFLEDTLQLDELHITLVKTSHDAPDATGYIIKDSKVSLVYITDTGYIHKKYFEILKNHTLYVMESNHDVELLMNGTYPYHTKQRILGDKGHLSNHDAAYYMQHFVGKNTKWVVLAHLSEENNTKELAYKNMKDAIDVKNIVVAEQYQEMDMIVL